jgi:single-stranded DNA-binding protein
VSSQNGPETDYISYSLWGEEAQRFVDKRDKGDEVGVVGRLRSSQIQLPGGGSRTVVEVRVVEVHYGRRSLKNMAPAPKSTSASRAIGQLQREFTT